MQTLKHTARDMVSMEIQMLKTLRWAVNPSTPSTVALQILQVGTRGLSMQVDPACISIGYGTSWTLILFA